MSKTLEFFRNAWDSIRHREAKLPCCRALPAAQTDEEVPLGTDLVRDQDYFLVQVNEMFLADERKWTSTYDPAVLVLTEFEYDGEIREVPFVVGPRMLDERGIKDNAGVVYRDTRVAGLHPYRGSTVGLTVILYRVRQDDSAKNLLNVVEQVSGALDVATTLPIYLKFASAVFGGVESLLGLDSTAPIVGLREEFDEAAQKPPRTGYYVLIDAPEEEIDVSRLWVRDRRLRHGDDLQTSVPYRDSDYVLYSVRSTSERRDVGMLPFGEIWTRVKKEACVPTPEGLESARRNMTSLYQSMTTSPDLTLDQAQALAGEYVAKMKKLHEGAVAIGVRGETKDDSPVRTARAQSLDF